MSEPLPDLANEPITVPTAAALLKLSIPRTQQLLVGGSCGDTRSRAGAG